MKGEPISILGTDIFPGEKATLDLEIAKLHTRTPLKVPVIVHRSKKPGPVLLLLAGVHGDEVNGVGIIREIMERDYHKPKAGTVICIPVLNIFGYLIHTREFPDGRDLNRVFPGTPKGSLASQMAYAFMNEIAPLVDYVLDFHTGGADRVNVPQTRCAFEQEETFDLCKAFGAPFIVQSKFIPKTIRQSFHNLGKKIVLFEGGKSNELDPEVVQQGVEGSYRVMQALGIHPGDPDTVKAPILIEESKWIRSSHSGMFKPKVKNGSMVAKGDLVGLIQDPFGEFERKIKAPLDGYIFCVNTAPIVNKGSALFNIGFAWR